MKYVLLLASCPFFRQEKWITEKLVAWWRTHSNKWPSQDSNPRQELWPPRTITTLTIQPHVPPLCSLEKPAFLSPQPSKGHYPFLYIAPHPTAALSLPAGSLLAPSRTLGHGLPPLLRLPLIALHLPARPSPHKPGISAAGLLVTSHPGQGPSCPGIATSKCLEPGRVSVVIMKWVDKNISKWILNNTFFVPHCSWHIARLIQCCWINNWVYNLIPESIFSFGFFFFPFSPSLFKKP